MTNRVKRRKLTKKEREIVYDKFGGNCAYCGIAITMSEMQVDHIMPLSLGGIDCLDNMFPACRSCNHYKSTLTVEKFRSEVAKFPDGLRRDSVTYRNAVRFGLVIPNIKPVVFYFEEDKGLKK